MHAHSNVLFTLSERQLLHRTVVAFNSILWFVHNVQGCILRPHSDPHNLLNITTLENRNFIRASPFDLCISLQSVTLHTDLGDIKIELFCDDCPKTCENFLALCASDYYNGSLFHRNIKGFIVQTGDPTGTGKGGQSIWGRKFEDEFKDTLKHHERGMISMANK